MTENVVESNTSPSNTNKGVSRRLDAAGWGLFFIWMGASHLMDLDWSVVLIGVAAVIFLKQAARRYFGRRLETLWVAFGVLVLLGGIWELYQVQFGLLPVLLIVVGGTLLLSLFRRRQHTHGRHPSRWCRQFCSTGGKW